MKIIEIENSRIADLIGYHITLYPFILYNGVPTTRVRKHEWVHIEQIQRLGVLRFYVSYFLCYLKCRALGMSSYDSYMSIPYEIEAYAKENE